MVAGNTYSTALVIGAKAAQIISRELVAAKDANRYADSVSTSGVEGGVRARL